MELHNLNDFLRLSAALNYQLSATSLGESSEVAIITNNAKVKEKDRRILVQALQYLKLAYGSRRRHLGPVAVLHPIRATALLSRAQPHPEMCDLLATLLHDKLEDLTPKEIGAAKWNELEQRFRQLLAGIDPDGSCRFKARLEFLTKSPTSHTYLEYVGQMLVGARELPGVVRVKLADRLDNTLDMRVDLSDPLEGENFYKHLFEILTVQSYKGFKPHVPHPPAGPLNGARRLYELFKNTVLLTLLRQSGLIEGDRTSRILFDAIANASVSEAQRILLHIFGYHLRDKRRQKRIIIDAMEYCQHGGINEVTKPDKPHRLDGLFVQSFEHVASEERQRKLQELYEDKPLMAEAAIAFIVIFSNFVNDDKYFIHGISTQGILPH